MEFVRLKPADRNKPGAIEQSDRRRGLLLVPAFSLLFVASLVIGEVGLAQMNYVARFTLEKQPFLLGEPIFTLFTIQNTGKRTFAFRYRSPTRALNRELEQEPRFVVTDEKGRQLPDPAPKPCGGARGSVVYGSVTLPPGHLHTERWLLNQWAWFASPGHYRVRAERRLPLLALDPATQKFSERPAAYALAINEHSLEISPSTDAQVRTLFEPYVKLLGDPAAPNFDEALMVVTTLPRPFLMRSLEAMANAAPGERRWNRQEALEGLARLGTPAAWEAILKVARGGESSGTPPARASGASAELALRSYAVLLLGQKGEPAYLPALLEMVSTSQEDLRGDVLRALGFFHDPRANQVLFEKLHSTQADDRVSAILGLRNLESRDTLPALLAMLDDSDARVRQVAHFALQSLTGQKFRLSARASLAESARTAKQWHAWWLEHGASFVPARQPPCRDW